MLPKIVEVVHKCKKTYNENGHFGNDAVLYFKKVKIPKILQGTVYLKSEFKLSDEANNSDFAEIEMYNVT